MSSPLYMTPMQVANVPITVTSPVVQTPPYVPIQMTSPVLPMTSENQDVLIEVTESVKPIHKKSAPGKSIAMIFVWLIILFLGALIIMVIVPPTFILDPETGNINIGKLVLAAAIIALIGVIIVWLIISCWN